MPSLKLCRQKKYQLKPSVRAFSGCIVTVGLNPSTFCGPSDGICPKYAPLGAGGEYVCRLPLRGSLSPLLTPARTPSRVW